VIKKGANLFFLFYWKIYYVWNYSSTNASELRLICTNLEFFLYWQIFKNDLLIKIKLIVAIQFQVSSSCIGLERTP
jgi:hypothetical protein